MTIATSNYDQYDSYVDGKISHMKRAGLVSGSKSGRGRNGGACPDWLVEAQKEEAKRVERATERAHIRATQARWSQAALYEARVVQLVPEPA